MLGGIVFILVMRLASLILIVPSIVIIAWISYTTLDTLRERVAVIAAAGAGASLAADVATNSTGFSFVVYMVGGSAIGLAVGTFLLIMRREEIRQIKKSKEQQDANE